MLLKIKENKGSYYALLSGFLYGLIGYLGIKIMQKDFSIYAMLFWRFFISSLIIFGILAYKKQLNWSNKKALSTLLIYGGFFYSTSSILFFEGSKSIGTGLSMVIFFSYPAAILLINWLLYKQTPPKSYYYVVALIIVGLFLLTDFSGLNFNLTGIGMGIISAFAFASYTILSKNIAIQPLMASLMVSIGCSITNLMLTGINHSFFVPNTISLWCNFLVFGIICTAIPIILYLEALKFISAEKASILSVLEPVFVVIFGIIFLGESLGYNQILGVIIVLSSAIFTLLNNSLKNQFDK